MRILSEVRPRAFLFENVDGLLHACHADHVADILRGFRRAGYNVGAKTTASGTRGFWQRLEPRGGKLTLLMRFADAAKYDPSFRWDDTIEPFIRAADLQKMHGAVIIRALRKLTGG
ncbi:DNA cytosine methyltransferase [Sinorhizobium medicae]|uniref:DNA cytosine methyltransferase n=1 Tax=Sinorhizobium medicae TaxID=110321 RepID=UPI001F238A0D|nr:DNA cytosine methyltransferase [Sinorhizobium medicae]UWU06589.1 DNA cytosine methyltransferase [Sinorhizobium medicae]